MAEMRRIHPDRLHPDPDVQLDWTFNPRWIKARLAEGGFDHDKAGMLDVTPNGNGDFNVFWGRHRAALAKASGSGPIRCLVHDEMTVAEKHAIKLAKDRDQRRVRAVETFLNEVGAGEETAVAITEIVEMNGRTVGKRRYDDNTIIEAIRSLQGLYRVGPDHLNAVFEFTDSVPEWVGAPGTNEAQWLDGVSYALLDGWPHRMKPRAFEAFGEHPPRIIIKHAQGEATLFGRTSSGNPQVSRLISERLRRIARVRAARPVITIEEEAQA